MGLTTLAISCLWSGSEFGPSLQRGEINFFLKSIFDQRPHLMVMHSHGLIIIRIGSILWVEGSSAQPWLIPDTNCSCRHQRKGRQEIAINCNISTALGGSDWRPFSEGVGKRPNFWLWDLGHNLKDPIDIQQVLQLYFRNILGEEIRLLSGYLMSIT